MAAKVIKEFQGFSGNQILLMKKHDMLFVRKIGQISRNVERMRALENIFLLPKIYSIHKNNLEMEYIHGLDMRTYLTNHSYDHLAEFLVSIIKKLSQTICTKDYREIYHKRLKEIQFDNFIFTKQQLIDKLPCELPSSQYYGDLTLENILYSDTKGFVLIDCHTSEYDSYVFDIAKLRQDLECKWFLRHHPTMIDVKLMHIQQHLLQTFPESNNDYLLILMLLRVYGYAKDQSFEKKFLEERINKLWK